MPQNQERVYIGAMGGFMDAVRLDVDKPEAWEMRNTGEFVCLEGLQDLVSEMNTAADVLLHGGSAPAEQSQ